MIDDEQVAWINRWIDEGRRIVAGLEVGERGGWNYPRLTWQRGMIVELVGYQGEWQIDKIDELGFHFNCITSHNNFQTSMMIAPADQIADFVRFSRFDEFAKRIERPQLQEDISVSSEPPPPCGIEHDPIVLAERIRKVFEILKHPEVSPNHTLSLAFALVTRDE